MSYPTQTELKLPLLETLAELGGSILVSEKGDEIERKLAGIFNLSPDEQSRTLEGRSGRKWRSDIKWARKKLLEDGFLDGTVRGRWKLTEKGYEYLSFYTFDAATKRIVHRSTIVADDDESSFPEGAEQFKIHRFYERNPIIVKKVKERRIQQNKEVRCDICNFSFEEQYGSDGRGFIEAHYTLPISELNGIKKTKIRDIALVCSNCHRMLHRRRPWLRMGELQQLLI